MFVSVVVAMPVEVVFGILMFYLFLAVEIVSFLVIYKFPFLEFGLLAMTWVVYDFSPM